ncbi:MAG: hypothetical protein H8E66_32160 [Planctomycetes bacterium]|nr:hypothetical protein [Planctomycetota bacterium]
MAEAETSIIVNGDPHHGAKARHGYSLWEYNGNEWSLKKDCTVLGAVPGGKPRVKGRFRGQMRMIPSVVA